MRQKIMSWWIIIGYAAAMLLAVGLLTLALRR